MSELEKISIARRGRPPVSVSQELSTPLKRGNTSWKPANVINVDGRDPGFRYRSVRNDPANVARKKAEGWETVSDVNNAAGTRNDVETDGVSKPHELTSVVGGPDWVLMRIPEETARKRDTYYNEKVAQRTRGLKDSASVAMRGVGSNAPVHGSISVDSFSGTQIID